jgi:hypothetical protein
MSRGNGKHRVKGQGKPPRKFGAMFDETYMKRATEMMKTGNQFFWMPDGDWYLAAQREHLTEKYTKTIFKVIPMFFKTRFELWPEKPSVTAMKFKQPWPNLLMLYHLNMCVWNRGIAKPRNKDGSVNKDGIVKIVLDDLWNQPIITFNAGTPEMVECIDTLRRNWNASKRVGRS